jgi:hypothetical protein
VLERAGQRSRVVNRVAASAVVSDGRDQQDAVLGGIVDRATFGRRGRRSAEREVDHPCTVIDRVEDRRRLVDVGERASSIRGLTTRRFESPPKPAIPSPFVEEPAASDATKVP